MEQLWPQDQQDIVVRIAYGINNGGQIVGRAYFPEYDEYQAFLMSPGQGVQALGVLPEGSQSGGIAINSSGQVVGYSYTQPDGTERAFLKNPGEPMQNLGTFGDGESRANDINDSGQVVGNAGGRAFLKNPGEPLQDLGVLDDQEESRAKGINNAGQIVGYLWDTYWHDNTAFIINPGEPMKILDNLVVNLPAGVNIAIANSINDQGQIVGWAYSAETDSNGGRIGHACLLTPIPPSKGLPFIMQLLLD
jgi:probable HAF family extracellular repeat protein